MRAGGRSIQSNAAKLCAQGVAVGVTAGVAVPEGAIGLAVAAGVDVVDGFPPVAGITLPAGLRTMTAKAKHTRLLSL